MPAAAWTGSTRSRCSRGRACAGSRPASRRSGTRPGADRLPTPASRPTIRPSSAADWLLDEEITCTAATGRCAGRSWRRAAGRSSSTTTTTPTSTTPPRWCSRCAGRRTPRLPATAAVDRGVAWMVGMQSRDGGWGAFDADNTSELVRQAAVLRLRRGHRPAVRRRHRARRRDAGARADSPSTEATRRGIDWLLRRAGARRLLVRPLGRQLRLRHRRRRAGAGRRRHRRPSDDRDPARRALARAAPERRRRLGRGPALLRRPGLDRARRVDRVADRLGAAGPARRRGAGRPAVERGRRLAGRDPARGRRAGTSRSSPAPASRATSTSTTTSTGSVFPLTALGRYAAIEAGRRSSRRLRIGGRSPCRSAPAPGIDGHSALRRNGPGAQLRTSADADGHRPWRASCGAVDRRRSAPGDAAARHASCRSEDGDDRSPWPDSAAASPSRLAPDRPDDDVGTPSSPRPDPRPGRAAALRAAAGDRRGHGVRVARRRAHWPVRSPSSASSSTRPPAAYELAHDSSPDVRGAVDAPPARPPPVVAWVAACSGRFCRSCASSRRCS